MIKNITIQLENHKEKYYINPKKPIKLSLSLHKNKNKAWYLKKPTNTPETFNKQIMSVSKGASVNFNSICFNPHAHSTHTECIGHISNKKVTINQVLKQHLYIAQLISITPKKKKTSKDLMITKKRIKKALETKNTITKPEALIIRTIPNNSSKKDKNYDNTNWTYLTPKACLFLRSIGIKHLLIDTPSVDKEKDNGKLLAHKAFWNYPNCICLERTITEMIYVPNKIKDGTYLLDLQVADFHNDASPSRPVLYKLYRI